MTTAMETAPPQTLREQVAEEVRALMARRRISGVQLAKRIGKSQTYVWRRLSGETPFDVDDLEALAGALGVPATAFLAVNRGGQQGVTKESLCPHRYQRRRAHLGERRVPSRILCRSVTGNGHRRSLSLCELFTPVSHLVNR